MAGRAVLLAAAVVAMATGIYGGLTRLGVPLAAAGGVEEMHGPLMVCGLFGTLIGLERAVAMGRLWPHLAPILCAAGTAAMLAGAPAAIALWLFVAGAAVLTAATLAIFLEQRALFTLALAAGAGALLVGNLFWLAGADIRGVVGWWMAFLVCTIAAERLELSRVLQPPASAQPLFAAAIALLFVGAGLGIDSGIGAIAMGAALVAVTIWLVRYDIARPNLNRAGATRYFATAMLAGYFWLALAGLVLVFGGGLALQYDMALHALFIGFVLSMVFGHALIILPAVTGIKLGYRNTLYVPLALLHLSVIFRVGGGLFEAAPEREFSGPLTAISLLVFAAVVAALVRRRPAVRAARPSHPH